MDEQIYTPEEVLDGFILQNNLKEKYKYEDTLQEVKESINKGKWEVLNDYSREPQIMAQVFLDFCESLSFQILGNSNVKDIQKTFQKSKLLFEEVDQSNDKKALHQLFEEDAKKQISNRVIFHITIILISNLK